MTKYLIQWNAGYGDNYDVVDVTTFDNAMDEAYQMWLEDAQGGAYYGAELLTKENAEEHGFEEELEDKDKRGTKQ